MLWYLQCPFISTWCIPSWFSGKESTCNSEDTGDESSIPGSGRSPGGGNHNPFQYTCLESPMDRGDWCDPVHGVTQQLHLSDPAAAAKSLQSSLTLCHPIDGSPPGSPVPGILQARALEGVSDPKHLPKGEHPQRTCKQATTSEGEETDPRG